MKQFEIAGRILTKQEQKMINGGEAPCPSGQSEYCCDVILTDGGHAQESVCASSLQRARVAAIQAHFSDAYSTTCELA